jgi:DNA (cytosine-5)-methyltransferase 1
VSRLDGYAVNYASVCSGVGSDHLAFGSLGWDCIFFSEIEKFPSAVLKHHWPDIPNLGDFTEIDTDVWKKKAIQLVVGGTPCQSFSVAGKQRGMDDKRGVLALEHVRLARSLGSRWFVWENVPNVLSTNGGRDFARLLQMLLECGYGFAYRILDAQYFGVAQRRRRVFLVGYLGDWRPAGAVLFESQGLRGNIEESQKKRPDVAGTLTNGSGKRGWNVSAEGAAGGHIQPVAKTLRAKSSDPLDPELYNYLPFNTTHMTSKTNRANPQWGSPCHTLARGDHPPAVAYHATQDPISGSVSPCLGKTSQIAVGVRRLMPVECERLQGLPVGHTQIPWRGKDKENCPDGHRYKAIGNGFAVPVVRWLGKRIDRVDTIVMGDTGRVDSSQDKNRAKQGYKKPSEGNTTDRRASQ